MKKALRKTVVQPQTGKVACFMLHATHRWQLQLRRYISADVLDCPGSHGYHNAVSAVIETVVCEPDAEGHYYGLPSGWSREDPRWPSKCDQCPYVFTEKDHWQVFHEHVYVDDAGKEYTLRNAPPGAMWYADWMGEWSKGPDGHALIVVCPDGRQWLIDGPANNCTDPNDRGPYGKHHRCWVRHGVPPNITVNKDGKTCRAGAGSIDTGKYHGFLRNGVFT